MPDISFDENNRAAFPSKYDGEVTLSKEKWDKICSQPERFYYRHNGDKVGTTLVNPDRCSLHKSNPDLVFYYKHFATYKVTDKAEGPIPGVQYMTVLIDRVKKRVCTVYPTNRMKMGTEYKGDSK